MKTSNPLSKRTQKSKPQKVYYTFFMDAFGNTLRKEVPFLPSNGFHWEIHPLDSRGSIYVKD